MEKFCLEYMVCGNATKSALVAGYSPKTAMSIGGENLRKPAIMSRLRELQEAAATTKIMSVAERKERLSEIARDKEPKADAVRAMAELNKMERVYETSTIVNNTIMLQVVYDE